MTLRICALIAARNEARYLRELLPRLAAQRIDVALIDQDSDDGSAALYREFAGTPLIAVENLPFDGYFRLHGILERKREILSRLHHDWVVHQDADELLEWDAPGHTLRDAIERADDQGCNVVDFLEFVFLPYESSRQPRTSHTEFRSYYHFAPVPDRLNRAWRRDAALDNSASGGHRLTGERRIAPAPGVLRHYIGLDQTHLRAKYLHRRFDPVNLARGWHANRVGLDARSLTLPARDHPVLRHRAAGDCLELARDAPQALHYWHWPRPRSWIDRLLRRNHA